ncbi:DUF1292 domain-containing protein [Lysinibacillus sp. KU-BSD001]|uniref:DUF1292 domain-containing protein n=1 Tax=Lysinibacillus sp. KU-BSD001 TaxID=3141328 RepID=UPI0036E3548B
MDEQIFILTNDAGEEQRCRVVFNFETDEHSYVLFTLINENGESTSDITALRYELDENGEMASFEDLETEEEWAMVEEVLNTLVAEFDQDQLNFFTVAGEDGEDIVCQVLHRFEANGKNYLFYGLADDEEKTEIFASAYEADENGMIIDLVPIETEEEWAMVEEMLTSLTDKEQ